MKKLILISLILSHSSILPVIIIEPCKSTGQVIGEVVGACLIWGAVGYLEEKCRQRDIAQAYERQVALNVYLQEQAHKQKLEEITYHNELSRGQQNLIFAYLGQFSLWFLIFVGILVLTLILGVSVLVAIAIINRRNN